MGSYSHSVLCPKCHMQAHLEEWYHSDSISLNCPICGYYFTKMYSWELGCEDSRYEYDEDGYWRNEYGGYGCVYLLSGDRNCCIYPRSFVDGVNQLSAEYVLEQLQKDEDSYSFFLNALGDDMPRIYAQTYFDGNILFATESIRGLHILDNCDIYVDSEGVSWVVYEYPVGEPFNKAIYDNVHHRNPEFDKLLCDEYNMSVNMLKGFGMYDAAVREISARYPDIPVMLPPPDQTPIPWDVIGYQQTEAYAKAHDLSIEEKFNNRFYPKVKIVMC